MNLYARILPRHLSVSLLLIMCTCFSCQPSSEVLMTEILVIGGGTSGTPAAIQAARMGAKVILIEETPWLGGMLTAAGVGATDGNHRLPSGLWGEFRDKLYAHYGGPDSVFTGWVSNTLFEPQVGNRFWNELADAEPSLTRLHGYRIKNVLREGNQLTGATFENAARERLTIHADILIEATELGDVLPLAGAAFTTGTDTPEDPFNEHIQDLTYTAVVAFFPDSVDVRIPRPPGYDPAEFTCLCKEVCEDEQRKVPTCDFMLNYGEMPNGKYMLNWPNNGNDYYANIIPLSYEQRDSVYRLAKERTLNFIYFLQNEAGYTQLGLAQGVFPTEDLLPFIPYHREARRVTGDLQLTVQDLQAPYADPERPLYHYAIAVGDYPLDHHHGKNPTAPEEEFPPIPSFSIPYQVMIPETVDDLIVAEKSISVSHLINGASRLQPAVILIGQAAGVAAALCVKDTLEPRELSFKKVQAALLEADCWLLPYLDITPTDPYFQAIQRIGTTGIMRGKGIPYKWANQTWFYPDSLILQDTHYLQILKRTAEYLEVEMIYPLSASRQVSYGQALLDMAHLLQPSPSAKDPTEALQFLQSKSGTELLPSAKAWDAPMKRKELAYLLDKLVKPLEK